MTRRTDRMAGLLARLLVVAMTAAVGACGEEPQAIEPEPSPPVEVRAAVDRAVATTGDLITYTVTVEHDAGLAVELPEPGAEIAGFRIVDLGGEGPRTEAGRVVRSRWYHLRADLVGSYVLPPVEVVYRPESDPAAQPVSVTASEIFVEVESVLPADGEVADIRGLKELRQIETGPPVLWLAAGAAAVLLAAWAIWWWWRRRRRGSEVPAPPPWEIAFLALDSLRKTDFGDLEAVRRYYFALSRIVRAYVEGRFDLNATDLTTEEIASRLGEVGELQADSRDNLTGFLTATDQVKFAARVPSEEDIQGVYDGALGFVEGTRPVEAEV